MNLIINTWEYLMGNPNYLPDTTVTLDLFKSCLCCDMLCPPPKPRDMKLPDGTVIKEQLRFTIEDNVAYICELATSLYTTFKSGIEIIIKPGYSSDEMLLSMLASTAETLNQPIYLTLKTKLFATDEEE